MSLGFYEFFEIFMSNNEIIEEIYSNFKNLLNENTKKIKQLNKWLEIEEGKNTFSNLLFSLGKLIRDSEEELSLLEVENIFKWETIGNDY